MDLTDDERGKVILAYAFAWIGGHRSQVIMLNRQQATEIRDKYSKGYAKAVREEKSDSPWQTSFDAMWAKSCVRRLVKVVPTSTELTELINADDDADDAGAVPSVIRGTVVARDGQEPGESSTEEPSWPTAAEPGSGAREGGDTE